MGDGREDDPSAKFGALLEPLLGELVVPSAAPEPEPELEPAPAPPLRLDEAELMALIFTSLDRDNPRVCEGIDFDRLWVLSEAIVEAAPPVEDRAAPAAEAASVAEPDAATASLDATQWIGRGWTDDIKTIPAELLDRPAPRPAWLELRARAEGRPLDRVNLRRLGRRAALRHLDLFIRACRAKGHRLCRVITGKGVESQAEPVLKRAVIEWCLGAHGPAGPAAVLAWAPWLDRHGEWGELVLELRATKAQ